MTHNEILDLYMDVSRTLAITFFRYIYKDESIEYSDVHFVGWRPDTAECWDLYFSTTDMYEVLKDWYSPELVKQWYEYMMVSNKIIGIRYFKHLVDTHGYTTAEQLLEDHKKEREENEKRINTPEYKAKEEAFIKTMNEKFISENF